MSIRMLAAAQQEKMAAWRHQIHQNPELGFQETKTTDLVKQVLSQAGVAIRPLDTPTGVLGVLSGEQGPGPVLVLRADLDALPMQEENNVPYRSQTANVMHACGHDGHTAILLGTANILASLKEKLCGEIRFLFQPAEETLYGAKQMIAAGVLDDPPADCVVGLHGSPLAEVGQMAIRRGPVMASADMVVITFSAAGGHGAYPHRTQDPIVAAGHFITAVQSIVSRQVNAVDSAVVSICSLEGGSAFNIIPTEAILKGTVRTLNESVREQMPQMLEQKAAGIAQAFGCNWQVEYTRGVPSVHNDSAVVDHLVAAGHKVLGPENVVFPPDPLMGSEDFAFYMEKVPTSAFFQLGFVRPGCPPPNLHNSHFDFDDDSLPAGAAVLSQFAADMLTR